MAYAVRQTRTKAPSMVAGVPTAGRVIRMSELCLCGAFARPEERREIGVFYPDTMARIERLEAEVRARGHADATWAWKSPAGVGQVSLPLCVACEAA